MVQDAPQGVPTKLGRKVLFRFAFVVVLSLKLSESDDESAMVWACIAYPAYLLLLQPLICFVRSGGCRTLWIGPFTIDICAEHQNFVLDCSLFLKHF